MLSRVMFEQLFKCKSPHKQKLLVVLWGLEYKKNGGCVGR